MYIYQRQFHKDAYFVALILMAVCVPLSKFGMSVMQFTLLGLWIWAGFSFKTTFSFFQNNPFFKAIGKFLVYLWHLTASNFVGKFSRFFKNKAAIVLASLFILHLIWLINTTDFSYAFKDIRTKLPLLALPVILSTMEPIQQKRFNFVMLFHAAAVLIGTFVSTWILIQGEFTDIRKISIYISPIRFALNICIATFTLLYFAWKKDIYSIPYRMVFFLISIWMIIFLIILESGIGIVILLSIFVLIALYFIAKQKNKILKTGLAVAIIAIPISVALYIYDIMHDFTQVEKVNFSELDTYTKQGNKYRHDTVYFGIEDGKYCGLYIAMDELRDAWNQRSEVNFEGRDKNDQLIKYTIIRYMASRNLRKDAEDLSMLSHSDIKAIERGIANANYLKSPSLRTRISKIMVGYYNFKYANDPNGSSVFQRIEFWKASLNLIRENFWWGVGTGDLNTAFDEYYKRTNSPLEEANRWRSHNQYLSIFVATGVFGFIWFLFVLVYPPLKLRKFTDYFYFVFFITIVLSMLTEDTIESQAGVTLFAFFNAFLLFCRKEQ